MNRFWESKRGRAELWIRPHPRRRDGGVDRYAFFDPVGMQDWTPLVAVRRGGCFGLNVRGHHVDLTFYVPGAHRFACWLNDLLIDRWERRHPQAPPFTVGRFGQEFRIPWPECES